MAEAQITCPHCRRRHPASELGATAEARCPQCGGSLAGDLVFRNTPTQTALLPGDATPPLPAGEIVLPLLLDLPRPFANYELLEEIGRGGMGLVFKARQLRLDRLVAVKVILAGHLAAPQEVERFYAEARAAARLQHPHIVAIHEVGEHENLHFFSMEYIQGRSLAALAAEQCLEAARAARYLHQVAEAVHYVHSQGILHRDLKPSNVLVDAYDRPRITDFGLARHYGSGDLTLSGAIVGTAGYMPPEQASGQRGQLGPHSDVYSLGATLYYLVTSRPPFQAGTVYDTLAAVMNRPPEPPCHYNAAVPPELEAICLRCLEKDPRRRYASARQLALDLEAFLHGRQPLAMAGAPCLAGPQPTSQSGEPGHGASGLREAPLADVPPAGDSAAGSITDLILASGKVDGFIDTDEEQDVLRRAATLGLSPTHAEALLENICNRHGWARQSRLSPQMLALLREATQNDGLVDEREYQQALQFAVERGMPRRKADEVCLTLMLDHGLCAKESFLNRWFSRKKERLGF